MDELNSFINRICHEFGCDPRMNEIVGKGYTSNILRISDKLCIKITEKKTCPEFPLSIRQCSNLCIPFKTFVSSSGKYYGYVQRYLNSTCLQDFIVNKKVLSEKETAYVIFDVLRGLELLHKNNYVHRDFYPGNIMLHLLDGVYSAVIIDFDETQKKNDDTRPCFRFSGYHAPEIVIDDDSYDEKSEIFAVGVIMWELLLGECPFGGYNYFGGIIAKSWNHYEQNRNYYHQQMVDALMILKKSIKQTENLSNECSDLLLKLLAENKEDRISASLALKHAFFSDIINSIGDVSD